MVFLWAYTLSLLKVIGDMTVMSFLHIPESDDNSWLLVIEVKPTQNWALKSVWLKHPFITRVTWTPWNAWHQTLHLWALTPIKATSPSKRAGCFPLGQSRSVDVIFCWCHATTFMPYRCGLFVIENEHLYGNSL